jgi:hypothetical protein
VSKPPSPSHLIGFDGELLWIDDSESLTRRDTRVVVVS